jgi:hypothetical protein
VAQRFSAAVIGLSSLAALAAEVAVRTFSAACSTRAVTVAKSAVASSRWENLRVERHFFRNQLFEANSAIKRLLSNTEGSALLEFAISLPLLVVFVVGIYDFSGSFNQKQKIEQAAQEGAIVAGAQPNSDIESSRANPDSLQPVVAAVFNSMDASDALTQGNEGTCALVPPPIAAHTTGTLIWAYTITGCPDDLVITINRGWVSTAGGPPTVDAVGTIVTVQYPYHWRFNSVIQLLIPGANYAATTNVTETATVHNQM